MEIFSKRILSIQVENVDSSVYGNKHNKCYINCSIFCFENDEQKDTVLIDEAKESYHDTEVVLIYLMLYIFSSHKMMI